MKGINSLVTQKVGGQDNSARGNNNMKNDQTIE